MVCSTLFPPVKNPAQPFSNKTHDSISAFVLNREGEALILECALGRRAWSSWQVLGSTLGEGENPITAVQEMLQYHTGFVATQWLYLGTFICDEATQTGATHVFFARGATAVAPPQSSNLVVKWVQREEIRQALLDGRITQISHAATASLALLLCD